jgi:pilus assembly protein CpaE
MRQVLRLAIVDPSDTTRDALKNMLLGLDRVWLEAECSRYEFFSDVIAQTHPDIGVVALDTNTDKALDLIDQVHKVSPECSIIVVSSSTDANVILRVMRSGAKEFLSRPVKIEDLVAALDRVAHLRSGRTDGKKSRSSTVIAVAGATGGVGSTSTAVNLGCILAADSKNSVVLVDLDLCLGDADVFLDAIPEYTILDVAQNVARLDFALLKRSLTKHASGLFLLPRPVHLEDIPLITAEDFKRVVGLLKATFTHLILDLSKSYGPLDLAAMEAADHVLLVTQLDLPCLRNVVRLNVSFNENQKIKDKLKIVVNRVGLDGGQITTKKAQETLGREIYWQLPNDYRTMSDVRNNGVPLIEQAPRASITQAMQQLAEALTCDEPVDGASGTSSGAGGDKSKKGWFNLLGKMKS